MKNFYQAISDINENYTGVEASVSVGGKLDVIFKEKIQDCYLTKLQFEQILKDHDLFVFHAYNGLGGTSFEMDYK